MPQNEHCWYNHLGYIQRWWASTLISWIRPSQSKHQIALESPSLGKQNRILRSTLATDAMQRVELSMWVQNRAHVYFPSSGLSFCGRDPPCVTYSNCDLNLKIFGRWYIDWQRDKQESTDMLSFPHYADICRLPMSEVGDLQPAFRRQGLPSYLQATLFHHINKARKMCNNSITRAKVMPVILSRCFGLNRF